MDFRVMYFGIFCIVLVLIILIRILNEIKRNNILLNKILLLSVDSELDKKDKEKIEKLITEGKKNEAIKLYRERTKTELKEAINAIDKFKYNS